MMHGMKKVFAAVMLAALCASSVAAHGGDTHIVDGRYAVALSRAPLTPRAGEKVSFVLSFGDLAKDALITENIVARVRIARFTAAGDRRDFLFEWRGVPVRGGALDFPYAFRAPGLYEIFVDFAFAADPKTIHEPEDFLIEVLPKKPPSPYPALAASGAFGAGACLSFVRAAPLFRRRSRHKKIVWRRPARPSAKE